MGNILLDIIHKMSLKYTKGYIKEIPMNIETLKPPKELNSKNVIYWSEHWKSLQGVKEGSAIQTKALRFLQEGCIEYQKDDYDPSKSCYICKPIKGYNKTTYHIRWSKDIKDFKCSCQFNVTTGRICSHILALYLQLKIWNYNKKNES